MHIKQKHTPTNRNYIALLHDTHLNRMAVDARAVGAVEIRQDHSTGLILKFDVKAANPVIVQLDRILFFASN